MNKADLIATYESLIPGYTDSFLKEILVPTGKKGLITGDYENAICTLQELQKVMHPRERIIRYKDLAAYVDPEILYRLKNKHALACRLDELKESKQKEVRGDPEWIFTEKINGCRAMLVCQGNGRRPRFFAREPGDDGLVDYYSKIMLGNIGYVGHAIAVDVELFFEPTADAVDLASALMDDGEATLFNKEQLCNSILSLSDENALHMQRSYFERTGKELFQIYIIHPLFYKGVNYFGRKISDGKKVLDALYHDLKALSLPVRTIRHSGCLPQEKQAFLDAILQSGGEGVVAHNLNAYLAPGRDKETWVKIKASGMVNLTDTIDAFVTGYTSSEDKVTKLVISAYVDKGDYNVVHKVGEITLSAAQRAKVTTYVAGSPVLKAELYSMVAEVAGTHFDSTGKLINLKLIRFRNDKFPCDCKLSEEYLKQYTRLNSKWPNQ
jgi:ATP-dependent DNA ligase